jgi:hypothetical protein
MTFCKSKTDSVIKPPEWADKHPAWLRLEDQLSWYDHKSGCAQRWYKWLKFIQIVLAISIPIVSQIENEGKWIASLAGALIAIIEAIQHMNQYSTLWITYRSTAERLKHEKYLFLSAAGPYRNLVESERLIALAERVEEHVSTEHANWFNEICRIAADTKKDKK